MDNKYRKIIENKRNGLDPLDNREYDEDNEYNSLKQETTKVDDNEIDIDKGLYTQETLDKFLFSDELADYIDGITMFDSKEIKENEIVIAPLTEMNKTFIGISSGSASDKHFKELRNTSADIAKLTRYFKPIFYIEGLYSYENSEDLFYYFRNGLRLFSIDELSEQEKLELQPTGDYGILSPYTIKDLEVLTLKKVKKLIDKHLEHYSEYNKETLKVLVECHKGIKDNNNTYIYLPLFNKVIGCHSS